MMEEYTLDKYSVENLFRKLKYHAIAGVSLYQKFHTLPVS